MVADAERYRIDELKHRERVLAKSSLESFCVSIKENVQKEKDMVLQKCTEIMEWLDKDDQKADKEDFEKKKREVEALLNKSGSLNGEASNAGMDGDSLVDSPPKKRIKPAPRSVRNSGNKK